jgi:hypothetical protein
VSAEVVVWSVWAAFALYWDLIAFYYVHRMRADPQWHPRELNRSGKISTKDYVRVMCIAAALLTLNGLWFPNFLLYKITKAPAVPESNIAVAEGQPFDFVLLVALPFIVSAFWLAIRFNIRSMKQMSRVKALSSDSECRERDSYEFKLRFLLDPNRILSDQDSPALREEKVKLIEIQRSLRLRAALLLMAAFLATVLALVLRSFHYFGRNTF